MAVTDIKIYAGDTEGWVSISEFGGASTLCELTDVSCDGLVSGNVLSVSADGSSWESAQIGDLSLGRPPLGSDWETNTVGWKFTNAGNLLMGTSIGQAQGPSPDPDEPSISSEWPEGTIGYEIDSLRVLFEEGSGGSTPSLPPGENAGDQYDEKNWSLDAGIANNEFVFARDGVFSNGKDWSVDGLTWARAPRTVDFNFAKVQQPVKLTSQGTLYLSADGTAFSYDMKSWYPIATWITGNASYGQRPLSTVFVNGGTAFIYARYRSSNDVTDSSAWQLRLLKFNPANGSFSRVLAGQSNQTDNLLAFPFLPTDITGSGGFVTFTTHEASNFVLGLQTNGTRVTRIDSQGVGAEVTSLNDRLPVESFTYGNNLICGKLDNGTTLSSDGTSWSSTSLFPQAGNYGDPYYDDVGRWHICGPAGQPLICYGEGNGSIITWSLVSQEVPSGGSGDAYVAATAGRVIVTQKLAETYLISGQVDGVYTVDVKLTQTSGEIFSIASPRLIIDNAETQQDANQIFVDRFQNAGNLLLGTEDSGGVWAAGTIGKALEDISKAEGPAGDDGKGWTGGSYDSGTGIVTFTSDDGLGFTTGDLRGANGTNGTDGKGWTGGSYDDSTGVVTFTSDDGLEFSTEDLRGSDGQNGGDGTPPIQTGGRLTLEAGVPVMAGDVVSPVLYYTPYSGDTFSVYDPDQSLWVARRFSELSLDISGLAANTVHDIFISYTSDSWLLTPVAWANDRARAVELSRLDGVAVSGSDNTHRWLGTFRTNAAGQVEAKKINNCLFNAYNKVQHIVQSYWLKQFAYGSLAWIPYANDSTNGQARASFVVGSPTPVSMTGSHTQRFMYTGVVLDDLSESWNGGGYQGTPGHNGSATVNVTTPAVTSQVAPSGYNFVQSVCYGLNGSSNGSDMTIQGVYFG